MSKKSMYVSVCVIWAKEYACLTDELTLIKIVTFESKISRRRYVR